MSVRDPNAPIPAEELTAYERWELPQVEEAESGDTAFGLSPEARRQAEEQRRQRELEEQQPEPLTAEEIEEIRKSAYQEGFEQGKEEGYQAGHEQGLKNGEAEINAQLGRLSQIMQALNKPIAGEERRIERAMVELVAIISRNVVREELKINTEGLLAIVREALGALNVGEERLRIHLHEDDRSYVEERLKELDEWEAGWRVVAHPKLSQGGCVVETEKSLVEADVENRIEEALKRLYQANVGQVSADEVEVGDDFEAMMAREGKADAGENASPTAQASERGEDVSSEAEAASEPPTPEEPTAESGEGSAAGSEQAAGESPETTQAQGASGAGEAAEPQAAAPESDGPEAANLSGAGGDGTAQPEEAHDSASAATDAEEPPAAQESDPDEAGDAESDGSGDDDEENTP